MKVRPTAAELDTMGPDFKKVWEEYFVNAPDKPVMFGCSIAGFLGDHTTVPAGKYMMNAAYLCYPYSRYVNVYITSLILWLTKKIFFLSFYRVLFLLFFCLFLSVSAYYLSLPLLTSLS